MSAGPSARGGAMSGPVRSGPASGRELSDAEDVIENGEYDNEECGAQYIAQSGHCAQKEDTYSIVYTDVQYKPFNTRFVFYSNVRL